MTSRRNSPGRLAQNVRAINRAAFTLVELLVVVVIAIILMAVTLPTVKYQMEETKVREAARQVNAFFASAKAQATATGRYAGVWLNLERVGDPTTPLGVYQCTQLFLAEVQAPYCGDVQNARVQIAGGNPPWALIFPPGTADSLPGLVPSAGDTFLIRFDYKGPWLLARRNATNGFEIPADFGPDGAPGVAGVDDDGNGNIDDLAEIGYSRTDDGPRPPLVGSPGPDMRNGRAGVDDDSDGIVDGIDTNNDGNIDIPDAEELNWPGSDDVRQFFAYQIQRPPQRVGQPLELPQGVVLDMSYSGLGQGETDQSGNLYGVEFHASAQVVGATGRGLIILFNPQGGVSGVSPLVDPVTGAVYDNQDLSKVHLLVGRTEKTNFPWVNFMESNMADGSAYWVSVNRRTGSVSTVENTPDVTLPIGTNDERKFYIRACREFAAKGDVKGGQ